MGRSTNQSSFRKVASRMKTVVEAYSEYLITNNIVSRSFLNLCAVSNSAIEYIRQLPDSFTDIRQTPLIEISTLQKYILQGHLGEYLPVQLGKCYPRKVFGESLPFVTFRRARYYSTSLLVALYPESWDTLVFNSKANYNILRSLPRDCTSNTC